MTSAQLDAYDRQRLSEARMIEAKCSGWWVTYGLYSRVLWAFGAPDGQPISAKTGSELLGLMRAAERSQAGPHYEGQSPFRH